MAKVGLCVVYLVPSLAKIKKEAATWRERRNDEHASEKIKKKPKGPLNDGAIIFINTLYQTNKHTQHAIHCPSPKRPKDQRRLHRQGRQRKVHDGLETARQQVSTDSDKLEISATLTESRLFFPRD